MILILLTGFTGFTGLKKSWLSGLPRHSFSEGVPATTTSPT